MREGIIMADGGPLIERHPSPGLSERLNGDPIPMLFIMGFIVGWLLMAIFGDWVWWRDLLVGYIVDHFSYTPVFLIVGVMAPLAAALFLLIMRRIERVPAVLA